MKSACLRGIFAALCLFASLGAAAQSELVIGLATPVTSLDPHFHNLGPNNAIAKHVFESLVKMDETQRLQPGLAESWKAVDPTTWEIKLRKGVKWHDGSDFTADDVIATLNRIPKVPNSPASFVTYTKPIVSATAVDAHTLRLKTERPHPLAPNDLVSIHIVPKKIADTAKTEEFNSGKAMIGTGPYKLIEYVAGDRIVLAPNPAYWGKKPDFGHVRFKMIPNGASRVAALLAGDVQMIADLPTADHAKLSQDARLSIASAVSNRVIYVHLDSNRDKSPFVTDKAGKPLEKNPLKDVRVRQAISKAIDRNAITSRIMEGQSQPAGQLLAEVFFGTSKKLPVEKFDPEGAKKLLAAAGYPDGFGLTLHAPNNRYINDEKIAQALAQYLTRAGIATKIETMPSSVFFSRAGKLEFSAMLAGWGAETGENSSPLRALVTTFDPKLGSGAANRGRFSDPGLDAVVQTAVSTIDDTKRGLMLAAASEKAIGEQQAVVPVHYEVSTWGMKKGIAYKARADQYTLASEVSKAK
ncbi:MAG: ABC transporter substrate-binding protein [Burkholderiaceae bacterium]